MKRHLSRTKWVAAGALILLVGLLSCPAASAQYSDIVVTRNWTVTTGTAWDVTLPRSLVGRVQDQAWLVIDGHSQGIAGDDIPPPEWKKPLRFYANINNSLDGEVKDILEAQGLPVKKNITVYRVSYGVGRPDEYTGPQTLRFRHSADMLAFNNDWLPAQTRCKIGDRITLFSAVAVDDGAIRLKIFDRMHRAYPNLPHDLAHRITIEVQFLRADKLLSR